MIDGWKPIERSGVSGVTYPSSSRTRKRLRVERGGAWHRGRETFVMDACMQRKEREGITPCARTETAVPSHYSLINVTHTLRRHAGPRQGFHQQLNPS
jgi:hypothetical protein